MTAVTPPRTTLPTIGDPGIVLDQPVMFQPYAAGPDIDVLPAYVPAPGLGVLPANAFLLHGDEPVLVDAGPGGLPEGAFEQALRAVVDPAEVRWLWLTHTDPDHIGGLAWLLDAAPELRVVTTYLAVGKLGFHQPVPLDRCWWANPGDTVHVGDRKLVALSPPSFDAPETTAVYDTRTAVLFSADTFGALLAAPVHDAGEIGRGALEEGLVRWSTIDSPWLHRVDRRRFEATLASVARLTPRQVLSSHLPPATGMVDDLLRLLALVPDADPWVGPDQQALEALLAQLQT
jgi:glyoxylase-like metal-dependent hydrolase (beta-lactamase superfamily II)